MAQARSFALRSLKVHGLLSFGEETLFEFGKLNIFVGPNGSGKSNLIDCLRIFKNCPLDVQQTFKDAGFEEWLFRDRQPDSLASIEVIVDIPALKRPISHQLALGPPIRSVARIEETIENK